jgi:hypothetical protein
MSDLNDLIHRSSVLAFEEGKKTEQRRIIGLLEKLAVQQQAVIDFNPKRADNKNREVVIATSYQIAALIKESKD